MYSAKCIGLLLGLGFASLALGSELSSARGAVAPVGFDIQGTPLPRSQVPQLRGRLDDMLVRLRQTPALAPLQGFAINQSIRLFEQPSALGAAPAAGWAHLLVRRVDPQRSERDAASGALRGVGEGPAIEVRANDQGALFGYSVGKDEQGDYYQFPVIPRRLQGFPVLQIGSKDVVVLHKAGRQPFAHISRERYLKGILADAREHLALLRDMLNDTGDEQLRAGLQGNIADWQRTVTARQAELEGMSEAERRSPTCQSSDQRGATFASCRTPGAVYYVTFSPEYFDPALPPSSVQLMSISVVNKGFLNDRVLGQKVRQAVAELDLAALRETLD